MSNCSIEESNNRGLRVDNFPGGGNGIFVGSRNARECDDLARCLSGCFHNVKKWSDDQQAKGNKNCARFTVGACGAVAIAAMLVAGYAIFQQPDCVEVCGMVDGLRACYC